MNCAITHDFYLGRGPDAEWVASIDLNQCACSSLAAIERAGTAEEFRRRVERLCLMVCRDETGYATSPPSSTWQWLWPTSHGTDRTYAFDGGAVWTCPRGQRWLARAGDYVPPSPEESPVVFPPARDTCGYTGIDAADTTARRYGPLLGHTHCDDIDELGMRILADLTLPPGPGTPSELAALRLRLAPDLRYAVTADSSAVELEIEVLGYRADDPAADLARDALASLPALYGWTDPDGGPPRFSVRVLIADAHRHASHPALADRHTRAVLTVH
ncbi:hypothetical protein M8542_36260 [Amycolatopsis sp. OK19-0408]|uniref:Uncharacterized protein n=1 Tax=Amycolatopsis iheyensis TaxID=2945988 RepID=A0A9X2NKM6_9PSEU|nr:hypothetical protein [Amycolatopsis iheyensis]MCR6488299.1 hypothetical protein [Amycolatopsis iheyensis]